MQLDLRHMKYLYPSKIIFLSIFLYATAVAGEPLSYLEKKYSSLFSSPLRPSIDLFLKTFNNDFSRANPFTIDPDREDSIKLAIFMKATFPPSTLENILTTLKKTWGYKYGEAVRNAKNLAALLKKHPDLCADNFNI